MNLQENLLPHEIVLLYLGILLFLVLLFVLIYYVIQSRKIKALPAFFMIPIIMIAWPSIQKVSIAGITAEIEHETEYVEQNPTDSEAKAELAKRVEEIEKRHISSSKTQIILADAHAALGDTVKALTYVGQVLKDQPDDTAAVNRREDFVIPKIGIENETLKLQQDPSDTITREKLEKSISTIEQMKVASPSTFLKLAKAKAAMGDTTKALKYVDSVLTRKPELKEGIKLKEDLLKPKTK